MKQAAFGELGANETAHDLALGLLMAWLPVLVLVTIVDRNPIAPQAIRRQLNQFVDDVRIALLNQNLRTTYVRETRRREEDFAWTEHLRNEDFFRGNFFTVFAGQGRLRWHYGVAHSILAGIETKFMAREGRDWLRHEDRALTHMVDGPEDGQVEGLSSFDFRMLWQIMSSIIIVLGTATGAFIVSCKRYPPLSFHVRAMADIEQDLTPTVGLGCRSGGYMIYVIITYTSFVIELTVWWSTSQDAVRSWIRRLSVENPLMRTLSLQLSRHDNNKWTKHVNFGLHKRLRWFNEASVREKVEVCVLRPFDIVGSTWLAYIVYMIVPCDI